MCSLRRAVKNIRAVNSAIRSHKALSLKQFTICLYVPREGQIRRPLAKWLQFAFSKQVESFKLNLGSPVLSIDYDIVFPSFRSACRLRELKLRCASMSGEAIELFLCNCPLLERLSVSADLTSDLVVPAGCRSLKYLGITNYRRSSGRLVKVSAPNLTRLKCKFGLRQVFLDENNTRNVVDASFSIFGPQDTMQRFANAAAKLEVLTIYLNDLMPTSFYIGNAFAVPEMPKLKKLVLQYLSIDHIKFLVPAIRLLRASPRVEEFKLVIRGYACGDEPAGRRRCEVVVPDPDPDEEEDVVPDSDPDEEEEDGKEEEEEALFWHWGVKVFEFWGFCGAHCVGDHMKMVSYIVDHCVGLKEISTCYSRLLLGTRIVVSSSSHSNPESPPTFPLRLVKYQHTYAATACTQTTSPHYIACSSLIVQTTSYSINYYY